MQTCRGMTTLNGASFLSWEVDEGLVLDALWGEEARPLGILEELEVEPMDQRRGGRRETNRPAAAGGERVPA